MITKQLVKSELYEFYIILPWYWLRLEVDVDRPVTRLVARDQAGVVLPQEVPDGARIESESRP